MDFFREDEEIGGWETTTELPQTTIVPETTATSTFVMFDSDSTTTVNQTSSDTIFTGPALHPVEVWIKWLGSHYTSILQYPLWSQIQNRAQQCSNFVQNLFDGMEPMAIVLIVLAIVIALVGLLAIFCQCCLWRRTKRKLQQRTFDTTSWFEYSVDREKFAHLDHNGNDLATNNLQMKKENLQNFYNDLSVSSKPKSEKDAKNVMNSSFKSQSEFSTIDIENCQLVQSFMRHDSDSGKDSKRVLIKKPNKSSMSRVEKKKMQKEKKERESDYFKHKIPQMPSNQYYYAFAPAMFGHCSMPILPQSTISYMASKRSKSRLVDEHNDLLLRSCSSSTASMPRPKIHTNESNYETQTCALNLSYDSADTDLSTDPTIEVDNAGIKSVSSSRTVLKAPTKVTTAATTTATTTKRSSSRAPAAAAAKASATTTGPQYNTATSDSKRKASIERAVKCRQQVPSSVAQQTQTRSHNAKFSTMTAITGASSSSAVSSSTSSTSTNRRFASSSAISKNPLYREFSNASDTTARAFNKSAVDMPASGVTFSSCSTFTRPPKKTSVSQSANKL